MGRGGVDLGHASGVSVRWGIDDDYSVDVVWHHNEFVQQGVVEMIWDFTPIYKPDDPYILWYYMAVPVLKGGYGTQVFQVNPWFLRSFCYSLAISYIKFLPWK